MSDTLKIHDSLDAHFQKNLEEMQRFLAQPGFSHTGEGVRETAEMALGYVKSLNPAEAELVETDGNPVVYGKVLSKKPNAKTLIAYSLYDIVPVVEEEWTFPPLGGTITDAEKIGVQPHLGKVLVSRGTHNQRGPMLAFVQVLKAYQAVTGDIPVNVLFAWEGEEEIGCPHLLQFIQKKLDVLKTADAFYMPSMRDDEDGNLVVNRGYKGKLNVEIEIKGGEWGGRLDGKPLWAANTGWIDAPMHRMIRLLGTLFDENQRAAVDGLYENVRPYDDEDTENMQNIKDTFNEDLFKKGLNISRFKNGMPGVEAIEDFIMAPCLNICGIVGGYTGPRIFTTQPQKVITKMDFRLPPSVSSQDALDKLRKHLDNHGFPEAEIRTFGMYEWSRTSAKTDIYQACLRAAERRGKKTIVWPTSPAVAPYGYFNQDPLQLPCIFAGTGHGARAHQADEYITVDGIIDNMKFVTDFLDEWATG